MLGKDHRMFLKKILKLFLGSVSAVYVIPNLALRFFNFDIVITRLFNVITYNNNVTIYSGLPIFFVLDMKKYTYTNKFKYPNFLSD